MLTPAHQVVSGSAAGIGTLGATLLWLRTCVQVGRIVPLSDHALYQTVVSPVAAVAGVEAVRLCITSYEVRHRERLLLAPSHALF